MLTPKYTSILEQRRDALHRELGPIFAATSPQAFVLEVGCGHGHFLTAYAAQHPERTCVGVDLVGERVDRAQRKRDRAKLANLHFLQAEARLFLEVLPERARIETVFVLFPDPWPKQRHNKHRIVQPGFLTSLALKAVPNCPLFFRTDFAPYFEAARNTITAHPRWELSGDPWPFEFATVFQQRAQAYLSLIARCKTPAGELNPVTSIRNAN